MKKYFALLILLSFISFNDQLSVAQEVGCDTSHSEGELVCENGVEYKFTCDACLNVFDEPLGVVPDGYTRDPNTGNCDICPNFAGDQAYVPEGYEKDSFLGVCFVDEDLCPNIEGVQGVYPYQNGTACDEEDLCPDIAGIQTVYPEQNGTACVAAVATNSSGPDIYWHYYKNGDTERSFFLN